MEINRLNRFGFVKSTILISIVLVLVLGFGYLLFLGIGASFINSDNLIISRKNVVVNQTLQLITVSGSTKYLFDIKPHPYADTSGKQVDIGTTPEKFSFMVKTGNLETVTPANISYSDSVPNDDYNNISHNGIPDDNAGTKFNVVVNFSKTANPNLTIINRVYVQKQNICKNALLRKLFMLPSKSKILETGIYQADYIFTLPQSDIAYIVS